MGIISECEFCFKVSNSNRTYTKQTELYDGVLEVMMCQNCGYAAEFERKRIIMRIKAQICFDALADQEGRCSNHSGKCYEIGLLVKELEEAK